MFVMLSRQRLQILVLVTLTSLVKSDTSQLDFRVETPYYANIHTSSQCYDEQATGSRKLDLDDCDSEDDMILILRTVHGRKQRANSLHHHQHQQQQQHHRSPVSSGTKGFPSTDHQLTNVIPRIADDLSSIRRVSGLKVATGVSRERREVTEQLQPPPPLTRSRSCRPTRADCTEKLPGLLESRLVDQCVGRAKCSVAVETSWIDSCNGYAQFAQVVYQCVPRETVLDICKPSEQTVYRTVHVTSPDFPSDYGPNLECVCALTTDVDQKLLVRVAAESVIEWSSDCSRDAVLIYDGLELSAARCGRLSPSGGGGLNITSKSNAVLVAFRTDVTRQRRGFWIAIEALGHVSVTCGPASFLLTTDPTSTSTSTLPDATATTEATIYDGKDHDVSSSSYDNSSAVELPSSASDNETSEEISSDAQLKLQMDESIDDVSDQHMSLIFVIVASIVFASFLVFLSAFFIIWVRRRHSKAQISSLYLNGQPASDSPVMGLQSIPRFGMSRRHDSNAVKQTSATFQHDHHHQQQQLQQKQQQQQQQAEHQYHQCQQQLQQQQPLASTSGESSTVATDSPSPPLAEPPLIVEVSSYRRRAGHTIHHPATPMKTHRQLLKHQHQQQQRNSSSRGQNSHQHLQYPQLFDTTAAAGRKASGGLVGLGGTLSPRSSAAAAAAAAALHRHNDHQTQSVDVLHVDVQQYMQQDAGQQSHPTQQQIQQLAVGTRHVSNGNGKALTHVNTEVTSKAVKNDSTGNCRLRHSTVNNKQTSAAIDSQITMQQQQQQQQHDDTASLDD